MKPNFKLFFRLYIGVLIAILAWTIWSPAQENTNAVAAVTTVAPGQGVQTATTVVTVERTSLTFGLDKISTFQGDWGGFPVWQYLASGLFIILAFILAKLIDISVTTAIKKWAEKTKTSIDDLLINLMHGPIRLLALVLMLQVGLKVFAWPDWLERYVNNAFKILIAFSFTYMIVRFVDVVISFIRNRGKGDKQFNDLLFPIISKVLKAVIVIVAALMTLDNLNVNVRSLIAGVSIGGLAIGLAAQDTLGNLFGAFSVFMDRPFKIGEFIKLSGTEGIVEEIGLRSTRIRNLDGHLITIPNKIMGNSIITNVARRPNIKTVTSVGITYDTPVEKVQQALKILEEVYRAHPETHDLILGFDKFADSSLNLTIIHWWKTVDYKKYVAGMAEMNIEIKRRFDEAGISFAFPSRTVYLRQDNDWKVDLPEKAA